MKKNNYFKNVWDNQYNHCWKATRYRKSPYISMGRWDSDIADKLEPRGKCHRRMSNINITGQIYG